MSEVTTDWSDVADALDAGWVLHLGVHSEDRGTIVLPMLYVREGRSLLLHGAVGNETLGELSDGSLVSGTVTLIDGLVVARSAFQSSVAYRCVMVRGSLSPLDGAEREAALGVITDSLIPGRREEIREPTSGEVRATVVLRYVLTDATLRTSPLQVSDTPSDHGTAVWAGVIPLDVIAGEPITAADVPSDVDVPASVRAWQPRRS